MNQSMVNELVILLTKLVLANAKPTDDLELIRELLEQTVTSANPPVVPLR